MDRLSAMEIFIRVIEMRSFSNAARHLRKGQPAITKSITQLEQYLGVKLLVRSTHGMAPTEAGLDFYERAKRIVFEANEADRAARGVGAALSGRLRVSAAVTFARLHIVPKLGPFLDANPLLQMDLILDDRNVDLIGEGIDVALRMGEMTDSSLTARKIGQRPRHVMATASYFESFGVPQAPGDLSSHNVIVYDIRGGGDLWSFTNGSSEVSVPVSGRLRISAAEGVREAVFADLGVTISSEWMFAPELANGRVQTVLADWALPPIDIWAVFPAGRQVSAKARAFVDLIEKELTK